MRILFQGDSVTDAGRNREDFYDLGDGYVKIVCDTLRRKYPNVDFEFINRGISGNRTEDLVQRWDADAVELAPDIISIMIGVNDTWHHTGLRDYETDEYYENNYREILCKIKEKTHAKILMLEQYLIPNGDYEHYFYDDMGDKLLITRKLAREFAEALVPTDGLFAAAVVGRPFTDFSPDGVHPNQTGCALIAEAYVNAISPIIESLL